MKRTLLRSILIGAWALASGTAIAQQQPPTITSASSTTFSAGVPGVFTVDTTGIPTPSITEGGALPSGITFVDNGDGTATLGGTATQAGAFPISIVAANGIGSNAAQAFTLTVNQYTTTTAITNAAPSPSTYGQPITFTATVSSSGGAPTGAVNFNSSGKLLGNGVITAGTASFTTMGHSYRAATTA